MSGDVIALALGTVLAVGALAFVLHPLFFHVAPRTASPARASRAGEDSAIRALREIEFDRATGKLSDADYESLRARYASEALRELRGETAAPAAAVGAAAGAGAAEDDVEARVRAYRLARLECAHCGLRPEPDAIYCSSCGEYLNGACPACLASITETSAAFCSTCGVPLAAAQPA